VIFLSLIYSKSSVAACAEQFSYFARFVAMIDSKALDFACSVVYRGLGFVANLALAVLRGVHRFVLFWC